MKIVDIDKLFKEFVADYISKNKDNLKGDVEEQKEAVYDAFSKTTFDALGGKTPIDFYDDEKDKTVEILKEHFVKNVPVSEYLIDALISYADEEELNALISDASEDDLLLIVIEVMIHKNSKIAVNGLIDLLFEGKRSKEVLDACVDYLSDKDVFDKINDYLSKENQVVTAQLCDLISRQKRHSYVMTKALETEFLKNPEKAPEYCSYLVEYGDESVLQTLYEGLNKATDYVSTKEILIAIEALGGEADFNRDFSKDKDYIAIKEAQKNERKNNR